METSRLVLIVDDNPENLRILGELIESIGHETAFAMNGHQALAFLEKETPDIILLDVIMPEMDGYRVCATLKGSRKTAGIPIIFITARSETADIVEGFTAGASDYITKPFNGSEVKVRIDNQLKIISYRNQLEAANSLLEEKNRELQSALKKLEKAALTDPLTGLWNRRAMCKRLNDEKERFERGAKPFSVVIGDVDYFKAFNDTYGHECGDFALETIARFLEENLRGQDTVSRWGGEEFLILLPETELGGAFQKIESIRALLSDHLFVFEEKKMRLSMSFGVVAFRSGLSIEACVKMADQAMYAGKQLGRNRVETLLANE
jgi:diguanylate cyclase (GGDEF)-like protein